MSHFSAGAQNRPYRVACAIGGLQAILAATFLLGGLLIQAGLVTPARCDTGVSGPTVVRVHETLVAHVFTQAELDSSAWHAKLAGQQVLSRGISGQWL